MLNLMDAADVFVAYRVSPAMLPLLISVVLLQTSFMLSFYAAQILYILIMPLKFKFTCFCILYRSLF